MADVRISSIKFLNFKALKQYSLKLEDTNILVGPNNAGKSTVISAFRILNVALRKARSKRAERVPLPHGLSGFGHKVPEQQISVSLENVATDYNADDSIIEFNLTNRNKLKLYFPNEGGCILHWETVGAPIVTPKKFANAFPITIQVVPVLGPLEHQEKSVKEDTVVNSLNTHRACRHFRNYWHYFDDGWSEFANMMMKKPERDIQSEKLTMFVSENRIDREIYWAGLGFQVWCQMLTHLSRANSASLVVIDEPEIYLHPDVQRQLLSILRNLKTDFLLATHSVEIIGEADPSEILLVNKEKRSAFRLRDIEGIQLALKSLGSAQNITLAHLARTKKILFVEGMNDYKAIRRFAKVLGHQELTSGNDLTPFESGGFSSWERIKSFAWGVKNTIGADMKLFAVYDRDYYCQEELDEILRSLKMELTGAHIHQQKEIENYLLNIDVLDRVLGNQVAAKNKRTGGDEKVEKSISQYLDEITNDMKLDAQSQYVAKRIDFHGKKKLDASTVGKEAMEVFEEKWSTLRTRLQIIPGKSVLRILRERVQSDYGVNLTDVQIIDEFNQDEISADMKEMITLLEEFRAS